MNSLTQEAPAVFTSAINRRLVAIAFADVAGFSRLMALNDAETVHRWKALRQQVMEPHMVRHGGRLVDLAGDGMLVEFASAVNAVRWAADVQRAQNREPNNENRFAMHLRIGINVDDVIAEDGRLQGDGVNIASRIHQAAEPGQIVVTAVVRDYVTNRLPVVFHDLGTPPMKNINRPIRVFAIEWVEGGKSDPLTQPYLSGPHGRLSRFCLSARSVEVTKTDTSETGSLTRSSPNCRAVAACT